MAGLGRHSSPRLHAQPRRGRSPARRHHRQLRRRHDDHVAVRPGTPLDDGRAVVFVTTIRRNLENELPQDTEQCPPRTLALGLDHDDFLAAMAPRPVIILAKERDYFDVRGSQQAFARLKRLYTLLGAEDNIGFFAGPTEHGYSQENREAMYRWFNKVTGISDTQSEPRLTIEKDETLQCMPHGQVAELKGRSVFFYTRQRSQQLVRERKSLTGDELKQAIGDVLKLPTLPDDTPDF